MRYSALVPVLLLSFMLFACGKQAFDQQLAIAAINNGATLIDVRTAEEFAGGHIENARRIGHTEIVGGVTQLALPKASTIVLYCRSGKRSSKAKTALEAAGYENVINGGGYSTLRHALDASSYPDSDM